MAGKITVEIGDDGDLLVSVGVLRELPIVSVSKMAISKWVSAGLPYETIGRRRVFPISKAIKWMIERGKIEVSSDAFDDIDRTQLPPDLRDKLASAELKEFKLKKERGLYVDIEEVQRQAFEIGKKTKESLKSISNRISNELSTISDPHIIRERIDAEIGKVLEDLSKEIESAV